MSRSLRAHLLLLAVAALWGATFVLVKDALRDISPLLFNLIRMALAALCLAVVYRRHLRRIDARALRGGAVVGFYLAAGYQFQTAGLARTTASKSAFITGLVVVLVPLLAAVRALRPPATRAPRWNAWAGAGIGFAGIVMLTLPSSTPSSNGLTFSINAINTGDLLTLGCALAFALHCVALAKASAPPPSQSGLRSAPAGPGPVVPGPLNSGPAVSAPVPFEQLALLQIAFCALFMAASSPLLERPWMHFTPRLAVALAVTSMLATAAAFSIQSWAQQFLPATHTALLLSLEPVFAALASFLFLGERMGARASAGALLVLAGIVLTELFPTPAPAATPVPGRGAVARCPLN